MCWCHVLIEDIVRHDQKGRTLLERSLLSEIADLPHRARELRRTLRAVHQGHHQIHRGGRAREARQGDAREADGWRDRGPSRPGCRRRRRLVTRAPSRSVRDGARHGKGRTSGASEREARRRRDGRLRSHHLGHAAPTVDDDRHGRWLGGRSGGGGGGWRGWCFEG